MQQEATADHAAEGVILSEALDRRAAERGRKRRRHLLALGLVPFVLLLAANIVLALGLSRVRGDLDEVRAAAARVAPARGAPANPAAEDEVAALKASVEEVQEMLRRQNARSEPVGTQDLEQDVEVLRRDVQNARAQTRCTDRALRRLDRTLRRLLTRNLDPETYVDGPPLPDC